MNTSVSGARQQGPGQRLGRFSSRPSRMRGDREDDRFCAASDRGRHQVTPARHARGRHAASTSAAPGDPTPSNDATIGLLRNRGGCCLDFSGPRLEAHAVEHARGPIGAVHPRRARGARPTPHFLGVRGVRAPRSRPPSRMPPGRPSRSWRPREPSRGALRRTRAR